MKKTSELSQRRRARRGKAKDMNKVRLANQLSILQLITIARKQIHPKKPLRALRLSERLFCKPQKTHFLAEAQGTQRKGKRRE